MYKKILGALLVASLIAQTVSAEPGHPKGHLTHINGHIQSIKEDSIELKSEQEVLAVKINSSTVVKAGRADSDAKLKVGEFVSVSATKPSNDELVAHEIFIYPADKGHQHLQ